jgi:TonB family protein
LNDEEGCDLDPRATVPILFAACLVLGLVLSAGCSHTLKSPQRSIPIGPVEDLITYDTPPSLVTSERPEYPDMARELGAEGRVLLKILVLEDGTIGGIEILESPHPMLAANAIKAVSACVFAPATSGGVPVRGTVVMPYMFSLKSSFTRTSVDAEAEEPTSGAYQPQPPRIEEPPVRDTKQPR